MEWDRRTISLYTTYYSVCRRELPIRGLLFGRQLLGPLDLPLPRERIPYGTFWKGKHLAQSSSPPLPCTTGNLLVGKIQIPGPQSWGFRLGRIEVGPLTFVFLKNGPGNSDVSQN